MVIGLIGLQSYDNVFRVKEDSNDAEEFEMCAEELICSFWKLSVTKEKFKITGVGMGNRYPLMGKCGRKIEIRNLKLVVAVLNLSMFLKNWGFVLEESNDGTAAKSPKK